MQRACHYFMLTVSASWDKMTSSFLFARSTEMSNEHLCSRICYKTLNSESFKKSETRDGTKGCHMDLTYAMAVSKCGSPRLLSPVGSVGSTLWYSPWFQLPGENLLTCPGKLSLISRMLFGEGRGLTPPPASTSFSSL